MELSASHLLHQEKSNRYAVVTICTPNFIPGTIVMIHSFLKYNSWYQGDFIILTDQVSEAMRTALSSFSNVKYRTVGATLLARSRAVAAADETGKIFESHFYSLELFNIHGYDRLFYVDSDMLILGSFLPLFDLNEEMICVGDGVYYKGELRDGASYNKRNPKLWEQKSKFWGDNFNAGLILFSGSMATAQHYEELTEMVKTEGYSDQAMRLQDQMIQNIYFRGRYTLVSAKYNFRMGIADEILEKDGVSLEQAVVIHYTARRKPWLHHEALNRMRKDPTYLQPFLRWQEHWLEYMQQLHTNSLSR